MQGMQVQTLVWEDPICLEATKPDCHNYRACSLEPQATTIKPMCFTTEARGSGAHALQQ